MERQNHMQERHKKFAFRKERGNRKEGLRTGCDEHGFCVVWSTEQRDIPLCRDQAGFSRASSLNPSRTEGIIFLYLRNQTGIPGALASAGTPLGYQAVFEWSQVEFMGLVNPAYSGCTPWLGAAGHGAVPGLIGLIPAGCIYEVAYLQFG